MLFFINHFIYVRYAVDISRLALFILTNSTLNAPPANHSLKGKPYQNINITKYIHDLTD